MRVGSKSDNGCDDEAATSGSTIGSACVATTARLRAEARCDLPPALFRLNGQWRGAEDE